MLTIVSDFRESVFQLRSLTRALMECCVLKLEEIQKIEIASQSPLVLPITASLSALLVNILQAAMTLCPEGLLYFSGSEKRKETLRLLDSISAAAASSWLTTPAPSFVGKDHLQRRIDLLGGAPMPPRTVFSYFPTVVLRQADKIIGTNFVPPLDSTLRVVQCCEWALNQSQFGDHYPVIVTIIFQKWLMAQPSKLAAESFLQVKKNSAPSPALFLDLEINNPPRFTFPC